MASNRFLTDITVDGKIGVGTASPDTKLHVNVASAADYVINANDRLKVKGDGTLWWGLAADYGKLTWDTGKAVVRGESGKALSLGANGTQDTIYINTSQNVGIGTTSPGAKLDVHGVTRTEGLQVRNDANSHNHSQLISNGTEGVLSLSNGSNWGLIARGNVNNPFVGAYYLGSLTFRGFGNSLGTSNANDRDLMRLDFSNQRVGIGTTSPAQKLHVSGGHILLDNNTEIRQKDSGGSERTIIELDSSDDLNIGGSYSGALKFIGGGSYAEVMRIHDDGNVGIGTTSPSQKLHIQGSANGNIKALIENTNTGTNAYATLGFQSDQNHSVHPALFLNGSNNTNYAGTNSLNMYQFGNFPLGFVTNNQTRMVVTGGGNVGIGTTGPAAKLQVYGNTNGAVITKVTNDNTGTSAYAETHWEGGTGGNELRIGVSHNYASSQWNNAWVYAINKDLALKAGSTGKSIKFYTNGSAESDVKAIINSSGNVGIGTTSPNQKLHLYGGNISIDNSGDVALIFAKSGASKYEWYLDNAANNFGLYDRGNSAWRFNVTNSGNVGIGTTSPVQKLHIHGGSSHSYLHFSNTDTGTTDSDGVDIGINTSEEAIIWQRENNIIKFGTNGTERMRITNSGNVGIGTTNPASGLDVKSDTNPTIRLTSGKTGTWTADEEMSSIEFYSSDTSGVGAGVRSAIRSLAHDSYGSRSELTFSVTGSSADTEAMRIDTYGNVGIGTSSPNYKLHVDGNIGIGEYLQHSGDNNTYLRFTSDLIRLATGGVEMMRFSESTTQNTVVVNEGGADVDFRVESDTDTHALFLEGSSGNVGIGTGSPSHQFQVHNSSGNGSQMNFTDSTTTAVDGSGLRVGWNGTYGQLYLFENSYLRFGTNNTERMRIDSSGNVGIGTTSPTNNLHVAGNTRVGSLLVGDSAASNTPATMLHIKSSGTSAVLRIEDSDNLNSYYDFLVDEGNGLYFKEGSTSRLFIQEGGNVGIGTTSPSAPLDVRASSYKVVRLGNDTTSHYTFSSGTSDNTLTLTCGSYYQAEVVITANQTNDGGYNNWYVRGLWSNNHTNHHWDILEEVGYLTGSDFSFTNGQNDVENSGKLVISHTYNSGSFVGMTVRVTDMYGTHSYSIS